MNRKPASGLFVTGTGTAVGKTYVAALVAAALQSQGIHVGVYKPVASGCRREGSDLVADDALALWNAAGRPGEPSHVCPQRFEAPLAPPLAARAEGRTVDAGLLRAGIEYWRSRSDIVLVEGAGGLLSPVTDDEYVADLARDLGYPLVVVAANELGVISHTLQTLVTAASVGLEVAAVVLNDTRPPSEDDPSRASNFEELRRRMGQREGATRDDAASGVVLRSAKPASVRVAPSVVLTSVGWQEQTFNPVVDWATFGGT
jgi:dethiobiotin synthetase